MKKTKTAYFRTDAGPSIGGGHLMRCLSMANRLTEAGWKCGFICRADSTSHLPLLEKDAQDILGLDCPPHVEASFMLDALPGGCDIIFIDHYELDATFETECRGWANKIFIIDDLADRSHDCDYLLDVSPERKAKDYAGLIPETSRLFLGPKYALLRPEFHRLRSASLRRRKHHQTVKKLLVNFGAADGKRLTMPVLNALKKLHIDIQVDVVVGSTFRNFDQFNDIVGSCNFPVTVHVDATHMAQLMSEADLAVGSCGITSWERCCLGLPALAIVTADNQKCIADKLSKLGAIQILGTWETFNPSEFQAEFMRCITQHQRLNRMSQKAAQICDGLGSSRLLHLITSPVQSRVNGTVRFVPASYNHADLIFRWQSNPEIRKFFRNPDIPEYNHHCQWVRDTVDDANKFLNIILHNNIPAGVLRLDKMERGKSLEVSIIVAPEMQGKGIGKAALLFARKLFPYHFFYAEVLPENTASVRLFKSAGFDVERSEMFVSAPD